MSPPPRPAFNPAQYRAWLLCAAIGTLSCGATERSGALPPNETTETDQKPSPKLSPQLGSPEPGHTSSAQELTSQASPTTRWTNCGAPSVGYHEPRDARSDDALKQCQFKPTGQGAIAQQCGTGNVRTPFDVRRLQRAVLDFDSETAAHIRSIAQRGKTQGRKARVFGMVGDSWTASRQFLGPFSARSPVGFTLAPEVRKSLQTDVAGAKGSTIIDWYRGIDAHVGQDSFAAQRAAKDGAQSSWAVPQHLSNPKISPVGRMIVRGSPAGALVMYGSNDATRRFVPVAKLQQRIQRNLSRIVDLLENEGVIPVLSTLPRHDEDPARPDCAPLGADASDWSVAVQTNALSAAVAELACRRHLPLIDLRYALDNLVNYGLGRDGTHPTSFAQGTGVLTSDGLQCGFNVRNYVSLLMLKRIKELVAQ